ncbi:MAG TPA: hypothetical protein DCY27_09755 [Desulfobacterales bacterium]|nr:hypothetical protein [Desulfobacterales bacterium]
MVISITWKTGIRSNLIFRLIAIAYQSTANYENHLPLAQASGPCCGYFLINSKLETQNLFSWYCLGVVVVNIFRFDVL